MFCGCGQSLRSSQLLMTWGPWLVLGCTCVALPTEADKSLPWAAPWDGENLERGGSSWHFSSALSKRSCFAEALNNLRWCAEQSEKQSRVESAWLYAQGAKPDEFIAWKALAVVSDVFNSVLEHQEPDSGGSGVIQSPVVHYWLSSRAFPESPWSSLWVHVCRIQPITFEGPLLQISGGHREDREGRETCWVIRRMRNDLQWSLNLRNWLFSSCSKFISHVQQGSWFMAVNYIELTNVASWNLVAKIKASPGINRLGRLKQFNYLSCANGIGYF